MAKFEPIVQWLLYQEDDHKNPGKIVDLKDGAGLTRLGLTQRWHAKDVPPTFFSTMLFDEAVAYAKLAYKKCYWFPISGDLINSEEVAACLFSFEVNASPNVATKTLQHVLDIKQDGWLGPKTLTELNSKDPVIVSKLFRAEWINFYHSLVSINPDKKQFLHSWINRASFPYPAQIPSIYQ